MKLPCKKSDLVFIEWLDAVGESTRMQATGIDCGLVVNQNVGWIVAESDTVVVLAHGLSTSGELDVFKIPKNCIRERVQITGRKAPQPSPVETETEHA